MNHWFRVGLVALTALIAPLIVLADDTRQVSDILFSHGLHVQSLELDCAYCHRAESSDAASDQLLPPEALCLTCHDGERAGAACQLCHRSADAPVGHPPERRTLHFSHVRHLKLKEMQCGSCHGQMATTYEPQAGLPRMNICLECHDGVRQSIECATCHTQPDVVTRAIHPTGWETDHRVAAQLNDPDCDGCHRADDRCSLCHQGDNLTGDIHPFNWPTLHGVEARGRTIDCASCHETQLFCVDCHSARSVQPADHLDGGWMDRHGEEARFDIESCDACHGTADVSCAKAGCHDG